MREFIDRARAAGSEGTWFQRTNVRFWDSAPSGPRFDLARTYVALSHAGVDQLLYNRALRRALNGLMLRLAPEARVLQSGVSHQGNSRQHVIGC